MDFDEIEDCMPEGGHTDNEGNMVSSAQWLHDFAKNVAAKEREACAGICDRFAVRGMHPAECAGAIRMRSNAIELTGALKAPERPEGVMLNELLGKNERKVVKLMSEQCGLNESMIVPTALLVEDLWMDSLDHIEVVMAIEEYFDVEIPDQDCDGIKTVQGVFDMVNKHVPN